ncbi:hypothetical protein ACHQM5_006760 [Ranunculus cassubicifolius]
MSEHAADNESSFCCGSSPRLLGYGRYRDIFVDPYYINNYLQPESYSSSKIYTPQQFADLLLYRLSIHLLRLYNLGARKFVVFNVGCLGCLPAIISLANPRPTTPCAEDVNSLVMLYNTKFPSMIATLERKLVAVAALAF